MYVLKSHHQHTREFTTIISMRNIAIWNFPFFLWSNQEFQSRISSLWINVFFRVKNAKIAMYRKRLEGDSLDEVLSCDDNRKNCNLFIWFAMKKKRKILKRKKNCQVFPHHFSRRCNHAVCCVWGTTSTIRLLLLKYLYT